MKSPLGWLTLLSLVCVLTVWLPSHATAYPEPSLAGQSWQYNFTFDTPQPIAVQGVDGKRKWYWYMTYKVVNNTDTERYFLPEITIATDRGDIITAGKNVPPSVFNAIKQRTGNTLLESPQQVAGRLLLGDDFAKESAAIWPQFDHDVDEVNVFVSGLSGETQVTINPLTGDQVALRKTLKIDLSTPGTRPHPQFQTVIQKGRTWILR